MCTPVHAHTCMCGDLRKVNQLHNRKLLSPNKYVISVLTINRLSCANMLTGVV